MSLYVQVVYQTALLDIVVVNVVDIDMLKCLCGVQMTQLQKQYYICVRIFFYLRKKIVK